MSGTQRFMLQGRVRSGSTLILVMIATAVALVLGLTFLASSATITGIAQTMEQHAQARQIAESGLTTAIDYVHRTPTWRNDRAAGRWVEDFSFGGGSYSIEADFAPNQSLAVNDTSFEEEVAQLSNPLVSPPMSGTIGGWDVQRTAALETGLTVPQIGVIASPNATLGDNHAFVSFGATVIGSGMFRQTLSQSLEPNTVYELKVDIAPTGLPVGDSSFGLRVLADNTVVASTTHAWVLTLPAPLGTPTTPPAQPPTPPEAVALLEVFDLSGPYVEYTLRFAASSSPPTGLMRLELFAESVAGLATQVAFDNVRLTAISMEPLLLTSTGHRLGASYEVAARLAIRLEDDNTMTPMIVEWNEP